MFFSWCSQYFMELQLEQVVLHELSVATRDQLWADNCISKNNRNDNETICTEVDRNTSNDNLGANVLNCCENNVTMQCKPFFFSFFANGSFYLCKMFFIFFFFFYLTINTFSRDSPMRSWCPCACQHQYFRLKFILYVKKKMDILSLLTIHLFLGLSPF